MTSCRISNVALLWARKHDGRCFRVSKRAYEVSDLWL